MKLRELVLFTGQMHVLLGAGIPLVPALDALRATEVAEGLADHLGKGNRLSSSMARYPGVFDKVYVRMVHLAEESGRLAEVFGNLARTLQRREESLQRVTRALIYPAVLLGFSALVTGFLFCYMLPRFLETFHGFGLQLPWMTRALMFVFAHPWWVPLSGVLGGVLIWRMEWRELPILRRLVRSRALAQLCSDMAMMVETGVPITTVMELLVGTTGCREWDAGLRLARSRLEAGQTLSEAMVAFPRLFTSTVAAAEPTGELSGFLLRLADLLTMEADVETEQVMALVEPLILGGLGLVVGVVVLAVFLPVYQLASFNP